MIILLTNKKNLFVCIGAFMVVKIIIEMVRMKLTGSGEGIGDLIKQLEEPLESVLLRMNIVTPPKHAKEKGAQLVETLKQYIVVILLMNLLVDS